MTIAAAKRFLRSANENIIEGHERSCRKVEKVLHFWPENEVLQRE